MAVTKQELEDRVKELEEHNEALVQELAEGAGPSAPAGPQIIRLITEVKKRAGALAASKSDGVPFPFRGIDGTVNHLAKHVEEVGIVVVPEVLDYELLHREQGNRVVKSAKLRVRYTFIAPDGSSISATTAGLADDYADRAAAQAQSVALRVALLQTFFLPTQSPEPEQTGQVVQDGAGAGAPQGDRAQQAAQRAGQQQSAVPQPVVQQAPNPDRETIRTKYIDNAESLYTRDQVNSVMDQVKQLEEFRGADKLYTEVLRRLDNGQLA